MAGAIALAFATELHALFTLKEQWDNGTISPLVPVISIMVLVILVVLIAIRSHFKEG